MDATGILSFSNGCDYILATYLEHEDISNAFDFANFLIIAHIWALLP